MIKPCFLIERSTSVLRGFSWFVENAIATNLSLKKRNEKDSNKRFGMRA